MSEKVRSPIAVKLCAECWLCKYTRDSKKKGMAYWLARCVQKICPWCYMANKKLKKDFQKSRFEHEVKYD
jgi:uncharacterized protein CbrC (UPF0167 family)